LSKVCISNQPKHIRSQADLVTYTNQGMSFHLSVNEFAFECEMVMIVIVCVFEIEVE